MRIGGSIALALIVFGAGLIAVPPAIHAQDQDAAPPVYVTPNSNNTAKPLFLRKLFGTDEPNSGIGTPKPYDFSHRNDAPEKHGFNQEANDAFYRGLEEYTSSVRSLFDERHQEQVAAAEQDRQRSYAFLATLRKTASASYPQAQHPGAGNFVHHGSKREHKVRNTTHAHSNAQSSGEAPPIYVQH